MCDNSTNVAKINFFMAKKNNKNLVTNRNTKPVQTRLDSYATKSKYPIYTFTTIYPINVIQYETFAFFQTNTFNI